MDGICNLCKEHKPLLKKSHIIPNFMYKGLFDEKHRIAHFNIHKSLEKEKITHTGLYDSDILCAQCDGDRIGKFESYASKILFTEKLSGKEALQYKYSKPKDGLQSIEVSNINYLKFKLFLLSILWKAHISKQAFFKDVQLGKHAEVIRGMLFDEDPGDEDEFQSAMLYIVSNKVPSQAIMQPRYLKGGGNNSYVFLINNVVYHYNISNHNKLSIFETGHIKKNNTMIIATLRDKTAVSYFDSLSQSKLRINSKT